MRLIALIEDERLGLCTIELKKLVGGSGGKSRS
jgi:hypothetical protein